MKNTLYLIVFISLSLIGCQFKVNQNQTIKNENIPKEIRTEVGFLNSKVIEAIKDKKMDPILNILSEDLIDKVEIEPLFNSVSELLSTADFKKLDEFYVINDRANVSNTIFSGLDNENDYILNYYALNKCVYISIIRAEVPPNEQLIFLIYGQTKNGWKLHHMHTGNYSLYGKTSIEYYNNAKHYDSLDYTIDALNALSFSTLTLRPSNEIFQYRIEKEILDLQKYLKDKVENKYGFPMTLEQVPTKPVIYRIAPYTLHDKYETIIKYYSQINLKDTTRLKEENLKMQEIIGNVFHGLDKEKDFLLYQAANELPEGPPKEIPVYKFFQDLRNISNLDL